MKKIFIPVFFLLAVPGILRATITPGSLTSENLHNPIAIDIPRPKLSWINTAQDNESGQMQTAWEIRVAGSRENLLKGKADLWNSGKVTSDESVNILYDGKTLGSRQDCWWQVRVWDKEGKMSGWSEPAFWSMGLLGSDDWKASWIGAPWQGESPLERPRSPKRPGQLVVPGQSPSAEVPPPAPMIRKVMNINRKVLNARAYVTGLGFFEFYVNGKKVSDDVLTPNVTLYGKRDDVGDIGIMTGNNFREYRVMYMTYDISDLLKQGENVLGAILGNGFYNPASYWTQGYGSPRFLGQIYIKYTDGTETIIASDNSWKTSRSPVVMDLVYDGEHYDARLEQAGWNSPGFDDSAWENAAVKEAPGGKMKAQMSPADKIMESLSPKKIERLGDGHYKVDFGEEISGWLHLRNINGEAGRKIGIKYLCESHVGGNTYTMKGSGSESYAARFTWFVFREVEITNWPGEIKPEQLSAEAVYTDVETTGRFECSNPLFNTINRIWWRSQTDNMHGGIASDCPHRERSPYTGDGQVACVTVMHNFNSKTFYTKWIRDILGAQNPANGYVPNGAPWQPGCGGGVAWGAAMNIMPWEYYLHYGDIHLLKENYEGMKGYIKYMLTWTDKDGIMFSQAPDKNKPNRWMNLGDWVAPGKLPMDEMVHTFYLWRCSELTAKAAKALGEDKDELYYNELSEKVRSAFMKKYFDNIKGTYGPYGGNIFALKMGVPADQKERVINALKNDIIAAGYHLDTGIFGTQFFFEILSENGMHDIAYKVMNQRTQPSYGWWIEQGATTTWEKWDGESSRNHPMFGGGIVWFYRKLAGMNADQAAPGYRHIIFRPEPVNEITYASYSNITPYGPAGIQWKREGASFNAEIKVPVGSAATVCIPAAKAEDVTFGDLNNKQNKLVEFLKMDSGYAVFSVRSGNYSFISTTQPDCNGLISFIQEEFNTGNFERVINLADSLKVNCKDNPGPITIADSLADMGQRIKLDFTLSEAEVMKQVETRIGPFSPEEKKIWEDKGWLEFRMIDGEKRYFKRTVSNLGLLKLFHEDRPDWLNKNSQDQALVFRLRHTGDVIKAAAMNQEQLVPINMKVYYTLTVDADAVPDGEIVRCWLPWPKSTHPRQEKVDLIDISSPQFTFAPDTAIHGTIYMEAMARKGIPTLFEVSFIYRSSATYFNPESIEPLPYDRYSRLFLKYTSEQPPQITFSDNVRRLSDSITGNEENPIIVVKKIYSWFKENIPWTGALEYSTMPDIPEYVIKNRRGDCGMQTFLFMSMLRYKGIPVRWQSGWMVPESGKNLHDWCEIYYEGTGWVPADISYDLQSSDNPALMNFYMSGIDSYRMILNEGISGPLHPGKTFRRSEPYDFQRGEVEWSGGNLYFDKWDYNMQIEYLR